MEPHNHVTVDRTLEQARAWLSIGNPVNADSKADSKAGLKAGSKADISGPPAGTRTRRKSGALAKHMAAFLNQPELSDVVLRFAGKQFRAHRLVLAAWSPILEERLSSAGASPSDGGHPGLPLVLDCDADWPVGVSRVDAETGQAALQQLLRFLYTGRAELGEAAVGPVLVLAQAYRIAGLQELCERHLAREIGQHNVEAAARWLDRAERDGLPVIRQNCLQVLRAYFQYLPERLWLGLGLDQLVALIEGSDIVVDYEYTLFTKIEAWMTAKQKQGEEDWQSRVDKILPNIRFPHMTVRQLQQVSQSALGGLIAQRRPALLAEAIQTRALAAEDVDDTQLAESGLVGPRLYLAYALPGKQRASEGRERSAYTRVRCTAGHQISKNTVFVKKRGQRYYQRSAGDFWRATFIPHEKASGGLWCLRIQMEPRSSQKGAVYCMVVAVKPREDTLEPIIVTHTGTEAGSNEKDDNRSTSKIVMCTPYTFLERPEYVHALQVVYMG